jgi:hypothetical protein
MRNHVAGALLASAILAVPALAALAPAAAAGTQAVATTPPQIIHLYTRHVCSVLHKTVAPSVGMMLQNDQTIAKSPDLFKAYNFALGYGSSASQDMAVQRLENLVGPLADNVIAIHKQLDNTDSFPTSIHGDDDRKILKLKNDMLRALASQEASLDIINGFVTTQQLSQMQHEGFGYIAAIAKPDAQKTGQLSPYLTETPPPGQDEVQGTLSNAGLASNPYELDLARIPGLTLGYNPVSRLKEGVEWTRTDAQKNEDVLSKDIVDLAKSCTSETTIIPNPSPTP